METEAMRGELIGALKAVRRLEAFGALEDLLQGEALVLQYLAEHRDRAVYPSELSGALHLSRSRITMALASLQRKGRIVMELSHKDRRRVKVFISDEGLRLAGEKQARMEQYFDRMLTGLGEEDAAALIALIGRCVRVMEDE